jgi:hypothetical protein
VFTAFTQRVHLHQHRKHLVWQVLRNFIAATERLTYRSAHHGSLLPSCEATNHSHGLIEGGDLSRAQYPLRSSRELREGTDKWFLWV